VTTALLVWDGALTFGWALLALGYLRLRRDDRARLVDALRHAGPDVRRRVAAALGRQSDIRRRPVEALRVHVPPREEGRSS
jgi:hypothetical protein